MHNEAVTAPMDGEALCQVLLGDPTLVRGGRIEPVWLARDLVFIDHAGAAPVLKCIDRASGATKWAKPVAEIVGDNVPATLALTPSGDLLLNAGDRAFLASPGDGTGRELSNAERAALIARVPGISRPSYPTILPPEMEVPSPDGAYVATLRDDDLWLRATGAGEDRRLSFDAVADPRWSTAGAAWSPDSQRLAAMWIDERTVDRVPLIDWAGDTSRVAWHPYMRANGAIAVWQVHLFDLATGEIRTIGGGDADHFAYIQGFSADGRELRYARMERCSKYVELLAHDVETGDTRLLLREEATTFLYWPPTFILGGAPVRFLADGRFLWLTEASGWRQVQLHDTNGVQIRTLTDASWPVTDIAGVDDRTGTLFFRGQPDAALPYDIQLFRVSLDGGEPVQLSAAEGVHELSLAPDGSHYVDRHSSLDRAPSTELRDAGGRLVAMLSRADIAGLKGLGWSPPERLCVKAADGETDLFGVLYKPYDFDPAHRYPVIEHIYAGPQAIAAPNAFGMTAPEAFAQLGYVTLVLDARGTPGRGKAFQDVAVGRMGDYEIADHAGAIRQAAATRPWMDLSRVGIFGISYGGYFTVRAMLRAPDLYRDGVALAPAELGPGIMGVPIECFEGRPGDNPERYAQLRNTDKLEGLRGDLMLIGATDDVNTPIEQTMAYIEALARLRKPFDQLVLPGCNHLFLTASGEPRIDVVYKAMLRHFARTLRPGE
jgi:dipeptidyl aminopeptidase/acylaminoacyl peptidase